jgi:hypothetical protein
MNKSLTKVVRVQKVPNKFGGPAWLGVFQDDDGAVWRVVPVGEKIETPKTRCWYSPRFMPALFVLRMLYESRWEGEAHYSAADYLTAAGY